MNKIAILFSSERISNLVGEEPPLCKNQFMKNSFLEGFCSLDGYILYKHGLWVRKCCQWLYFVCLRISLQFEFKFLFCSFFITAGKFREKVNLVNGKGGLNGNWDITARSRSQILKRNIKGFAYFFMIFQKIF